MKADAPRIRPDDVLDLITQIVENIPNMVFVKDAEDLCFVLFNRAGEDAWLIGLSYTFSRFGLDGLSAFSNFVDSDTPDNGSAASPDQQELDITVDYRFPGELLKGLWIRARAAFVDQDGTGADDINDYRVILNYSIPLQ